MGRVHGLTKSGLFNSVDQLVESKYSELVEIRRHLHMHPELSWNEEKTTRLVAEQLSKMGLSFHPGPRGRGGTSDIGSASSNRADLIAVRGDIDAIPVLEENDVEYCSRHEEVMHACGHDVHTTVLLGVCSVLSDLAKSGKVPFPFKMRAVFQPAEEVAQGAVEMLQHGSLDDVKAILAMHVDPHREIGCIGLKDHLQTAACDEIIIRIHASGGHGARPHETTDPIVTAAQFVNSAYCQIPRSFDIRKHAVLSFCQIKGGLSANVIPTKVKIHGTLRTFDASVRDTILGQLNTIAVHTGRAHGTTINIETGVSVPSINNSPKIVNLFRRSAETFLQAESIQIAEPSMGSEDFACFQQRVQGALVRIGSANGEKGMAPLHSPHFDVDEDVIRVACKLLARAVLIWSSDHADSNHDPNMTGH